MIKVAGHVIKPDIFPDKTQQVWKLPAEVLSATRIDWEYEGDYELVTLAQLTDLMLISSTSFQRPVVHIDFLPYGRQDKGVSNMATFGLVSFVKLLSCMWIGGVITVDVHSDVAKTAAAEYGLMLSNVFPHAEISNAIKGSESEVLCFPDKGAMTRYCRHLDHPAVYCEKVRDQLTSEILSLELKSDIDLTGKNVIIIDDICDGGRTFIEVTKLLRSKNVGRVTLYVSHGIFSKGTKILLDSGIDMLYTLRGKVE
jgi:ribose-phosphate pyrophosphokinase